MKKTTLVLLAAALAPTLAMAHQEGDFIFRAGTATVRPHVGSDNVLGLGSFNANNNTQLGLTFGYMVTDHIGVELLAASPFKHNVSIEGVGTLASTRQLPPTLMAQYYFAPSQSAFQPYVGLGLNYTTFFDSKFNDNGKAAGLSNLSLKDSWGVAGQVGMDYQLNKNWLLNMSVWWMNIETKVKFDAGTESQSINTRLDPWVLMLGAGYTF